MKAEPSPAAPEVSPRTPLQALPDSGARSGERADKMSWIQRHAGLAWTAPTLAPVGAGLSADVHHFAFVVAMEAIACETITLVIFIVGKTVLRAIAYRWGTDIIYGREGAARQRSQLSEEALWIVLGVSRSKGK